MLERIRRKPLVYLPPSSRDRLKLPPMRPEPRWIRRARHARKSRLTAKYSAARYPLLWYPNEGLLVRMTGSALPVDANGYTIFSPSGTPQDGYNGAAPATTTTMRLYISRATGMDAGDYWFTITSGSATAGATYTNNSETFTVLFTVSGATTIKTNGTGAPQSSGTLTKASGTGDGTLTFSSVTAFDTAKEASSAQPARTIWAALNRSRKGSPDHVLLKCGETYDNEIIGGPTSVDQFDRYGKSSTEVFVVGAWADSDKTSCNPGYPNVRPLVELPFNKNGYYPSNPDAGTDRTTALTQGGNHVWLVGLHITNPWLNPNHSKYICAPQNVTVDADADTITFPSSFITDFMVSGDLTQVFWAPGTTPPTGVTAGVVYSIEQVSGNEFLLWNAPESYGPSGHTMARTVSGSTYCSFLEPIEGNFVPDMEITGTDIPTDTLVVSIQQRTSFSGTLSWSSGDNKITFAPGDVDTLQVGMCLDDELIGSGLVGGARITSIDSGANQATFNTTWTDTVASGGSAHFESGVVMSAASTATHDGDISVGFVRTAANQVSFADTGTGDQSVVASPVADAIPFGIGGCTCDSTGFEDMLSTYGAANGINLDGNVSWGTQGVFVNRCIVQYAWGQGVHSFSTVDGIVVNETLIDSSGWSEFGNTYDDNLFDVLGNDVNSWRRGSPVTTGAGNQLLHVMYFSGNETDPGFQDFYSNILTRGNWSDAYQFRPGGTLRRNLFMDALQAANYGWSDGGDHLFEENVLTGNIDSVSSSQDSAYWNGDATFNANIATNATNGSYDSLSQDRYGFTFEAVDTATGSITGTGNIFWNWRDRLDLLSAGNPGLITWASSNTMFRFGSDDGTYDDRYPDPDRDMDTYCANVLSIPGGDFTDFIAGAALQQKGNWREEYTASAFYDYLAEGFGIDSGPTYHTVRLEVTAA